MKTKKNPNYKTTYGRERKKELTVASPSPREAYYCQDEQDVAKNSCSRCTVCRSRAHRSKSKVALVIS